MDKIYDKLCDLLEEMEKKNTLSASDIQIIDWITHAKKSILCIEEMEGGYSEDDGGSYRGSYRGSNRGSYNSYEGNSGRRGSYRSSRRSMRRDSMGRYSGDDGYSGHEGFMGELEDLMDRAPDEKTRQSIERMMRELDK